MNNPFGWIPYVKNRIELLTTSAICEFVVSLICKMEHGSNYVQPDLCVLQELIWCYDLCSHSNKRLLIISIICDGSIIVHLSDADAIEGTIIRCTACGFLLVMCIICDET